MCDHDLLQTICCNSGLFSTSTCPMQCMLVNTRMTKTLDLQDAEAVAYAVQQYAEEKRLSVEQAQTVIGTQPRCVLPPHEIINRNWVV